MLKTMFNNVKKENPLIHNITNYVTVNDCANILLAVGASPIMSDDISEVEEITTICQGLNINIGTLNDRTIESMIKTVEKATELKHSIVLDPVGAGASKLRTETAKKLISKAKFTVIRGNISEIKALAFNSADTKGVDVNISDIVNDNNLQETVKFLKQFSKDTNSIIVVTGAIDIVTNGVKTYCIYNGNKMMSSITGTGCQLSALISAFITANSKMQLEATVAAVCTMGVCGEIAYERLSELDGNSTYRNYIIDAVYRLNGDELESRAVFKMF